jgi:hypothetical protein
MEGHPTPAPPAVVVAADLRGKRKRNTQGDIAADLGYELALRFNDRL